jgi:hypothetical protein
MNSVHDANDVQRKLDLTRTASSIVDSVKSGQAYASPLWNMANINAYMQSRVRARALEARKRFTVVERTHIHRY